MRWLLEALTGIAQGRKLPKFADRSFFRTATRRRLGRPSKTPGNKVLYFVDLYANYFDVELANALVSILEHHAISVYVPSGQLSSAMPLIAQGSVERARAIAKRNVRLLADAIRLGYHVVATEPSAALCLTHEYRHLLDDDDTELVAENTSEACDFLWEMHVAGKLELDLKPLNVTIGYHEPCHVRALGTQNAGEKLLRLIPGVTVNRIDQGCSGMAGTYGLRRENYISSLRMGLGLITQMRDSTVQLGATECSACKIQMQHGTAKPTLHPLRLLAASYGLAPNPVYVPPRNRFRR
jgi:Fe-S oxidoreductase